MKEASFYQRVQGPGARVQCQLCPHNCLIADGKRGVCGVRENQGGKLYSLVYGKLVSAAVDPVEKKPLFHFLPGSYSYSIATAGCNFRCDFCQNWQISQVGKGQGARVQGPVLGEAVLPEQVVKGAFDNKCRSIAYTYTEPTIFFEYAIDTAKIAREQGLKNIFVTNGYMTKECLESSRPYIDAANVDLKFFNDASYKKVCVGQLQPVLDSIKLMHELGIWVEVTTLIVPGENDSEKELRGIAGFLSGIDKDMPWHISKFHPDYKFTEYPDTSEETLKRAVGYGRDAGLSYVYAGNVCGWGNDTYCASCKRLVIKREGFGVTGYDIKNGLCSFCNARISGLFQ